MLNLVLLSLAIAAGQATQRVSVQQSSGWCSPNIANVIGNVTVNCIGVDPRALKRLNAELSRKNLELADRIRQANEWTTRYKELESQLQRSGDNTRLRRQA